MLPLKIFLASPLLLPAATADVAKRCASRKPAPTKIEVVFEQKKTEYDFTKTLSQITALGREHVTAGAAAHVSGLTVGSIGFEFQNRMTARSGGYLGAYQCPFVEALEVRVTYSDIIYVASEYKDGSCLFREIMEHEQKHHKANIAAAKAFAAQLEKDLPAIIPYAERRNIGKGSMQKGFDALTENMREALVFYNKDAMKKMASSNAKIDTPEEYTRVSRTCIGETISNFRLW